MDTDENAKLSLFICVFYALGCIRVHLRFDSFKFFGL